MIKIWPALALIALLTSFSCVATADWQGPDEVLKQAQVGNPEAQLEMGILYEFGFYMTQNKAPALAWYMLSADQGNKQAAIRRDMLQQTMSPEEIEQARQMSLSLVKGAPPAPPAQTPEPIGGATTAPAAPINTAPEEVITEAADAAMELDAPSEPEPDAVPQ